MKFMRYQTQLSPSLVTLASWTAINKFIKCAANIPDYCLATSKKKTVPVRFSLGIKYLSRSTVKQMKPSRPCTNHPNAPNNSHV